MGLQLSWSIHALPLWFLVFSLLLPRLTLLVFFAQNGEIPMHLQGWLPVTAGVVLPRALIIYLVYVDQGTSIWLIAHVLAAFGVWSSLIRGATMRSH